VSAYANDQGKSCKLGFGFIFIRLNAVIRVVRTSRLKPDVSLSFFLKKQKQNNDEIMKVV